MNRDQVATIADALSAWLSFQVHCKRGMLLSEAATSQPIGEFVLARHKGSVETEWTDPGLNQSNAGRPRQIDFALFSPEARRLVAAIEAKWISDRQIGKQKLVDDLLRLERVRSPDGQRVFRYFVVAGEHAHFEANFEECAVNIGGGRQPFLPDLLSLDPTRHTVSIAVKKASPAIAKYFKSFAAEYHTKIPIAFKTRLLKLSKSTSTLVCAAVWEIQSNRNRRDFLP